MLQVGILGCGRIVRLAHLRVLSGMAGVRVAAIADVDAASREYAARQAPEARVVSEVGELLAIPGLHAVVVALPTSHHRDAAVAAFERGLHVYQEKPIAATVDEAEEVVRAWTQARTVGRIGFNLRFNRLYREMRDALRAGAIGTPVTARMSYTANWPQEAAWRVAPDAGGGALLELASHHADLCRFLFDTEVRDVQASTWSMRGTDESAMLQLRLASDVRVQLQVCYGTIEEDRVEVYGTSGKLVVDRYDSLALEHTPPQAAGGMATSVRRLVREARALPYGLEKRRVPAQEPSFTASLSSFVDAIRGTAEPVPDLNDGLQSLRVIDAARRSAALGERVSV
jgi:1,5-anhydro-D-fructose reductase (1,5-anhydro-D-mannitol-forming)